MGMSHIELAKWADLILVAPASADFIADFTHGKADNLLGAVLLATSAKVAVSYTHLTLPTKRIV